MRDDIEDLACWYLAALQALAYATRHIVDALATRAGRSTSLVACGGAPPTRGGCKRTPTRSGCRLPCPAEPDAVLLGAAMLGATAAGVHESLTDAMAR